MLLILFHANDICAMSSTDDTSDTNGCIKMPTEFLQQRVFNDFYHHLVEHNDSPPAWRFANTNKEHSLWYITQQLDPTTKAHDICGRPL